MTLPIAEVIMHHSNSLSVTLRHALITNAH